MERITEQQFLEIYEEISDAIFRKCYYKTSSREVALDLTQDTFLKSWVYIQEGNEVDNLKAFIFTVAGNLIKDYYKKKKARPMSTMQFYDPHSEPDELQDSSLLAEVEHTLSKLEEMKDEDRELLEKRLIEDRSIQEIAEEYGERENTISVRYHRALKRYRDILGDYEF